MDNRISRSRTRWAPGSQIGRGGRTPGNLPANSTSMNSQIRLVIADDHALFRGGLKSLLRRQRDMQIVGEVDKVELLKPTLARVACDVLLLDLQMERWALNDIGDLASLTKVLVLTASE